MSRDNIYKAVGGVAAIAVVVFAAVAMSASQLRISLVAICIIVLAWRRLERVPRSDQVQAIAIVILVAAVGWIVIAGIRAEGENNGSAPDPQHEAMPGKVVHVYNKVTSGAQRMGEDDKEVFLTTKPVGFCSERGCNIPGTRRETGDTYDAAICQMQGGEEITNGNDINKLDDHNPQLFDSRRYYGVRLDDGTFGYVSEVWIYPRERGGLGLPAC